MYAYEDLVAWATSTGTAITIALGEPRAADAPYIARIDAFSLKSEGKTLGEAIINLFGDLESFVATHPMEGEIIRAPCTQVESDESRASRVDA
jgi:hypothetical protein